MLAIFAVIIGGIVTGRLLVGWRLAFVQRLITFIIWALLFLLGVEVGSDPGGRRLSGDARGGRLCDLRAVRCGERLRCVVAVAAYSRPRCVCGRRRRCGQSSRFRVDGLKGSLVIVAFFVAGCVAGLFAAVDMTGRV